MGHSRIISFHFLFFYSLVVHTPPEKNALSIIQKYGTCAIFRFIHTHLEIIWGDLSRFFHYTIHHFDYYFYFYVMVLVSALSFSCALSFIPSLKKFFFLFPPILQNFQNYGVTTTKSERSS